MYSIAHVVDMWPLLYNKIFRCLERQLTMNMVISFQIIIDSSAFPLSDLAGVHPPTVEVSLFVLLLFGAGLLVSRGFGFIKI